MVCRKKLWSTEKIKDAFSGEHIPDVCMFICISTWRLLNLNSVNQLIFVMVKCGVLFEVRTGFLNNI
jgi:hypothetical protein